jgi:hypothetical protein
VGHLMPVRSLIAGRRPPTSIMPLYSYKQYCNAEVQGNKIAITLRLHGMNAVSIVPQRQRRERDLCSCPDVEISERVNCFPIARLRSLFNVSLCPKLYSAQTKPQSAIALSRPKLTIWGAIVSLG